MGRSGTSRVHGARGTLQPPQLELPELGGGAGAAKRAFTSRPDPPGSHAPPPLSPPCPHTSHTPKKRRSPENAAGLAHNGSRMGPCRRTTGPLLPRRDPKPAFLGKKAELRTAFQCVFSQKNKYKGIFFFSSRHSPLNQERSVCSPTSYMMCYTVNNPA